jgi:hypothetical protein
VDRPRWQHRLRLVVPYEIASYIALLVIAGGSNDKVPEAEANPLLAIAAVMTRSVTAELRMVPNQPLTFSGKTDPRAEDGIIAYSWDKYPGPRRRDLAGAAADDEERGARSGRDHRLLLQPRRRWRRNCQSASASLECCCSRIFRSLDRLNYQFW